MDIKEIESFITAIPEVNQWIDSIVEKYIHDMKPIESLPFSRLKNNFSAERLKRVNVMIMHDEIPSPPFHELGLSMFKNFENMPKGWITYKNNYFIQDKFATEDAHFHELIHTIQWDALGANNFLVAYGFVEAGYGFDNSPFEFIAYRLQSLFKEKKILNENVESYVRNHAISLWEEIQEYLVRLLPDFSINRLPD